MDLFEQFESMRHWSDEEKIVIDQVTKLADQEFKPRADKYAENAEFPWENLNAIKELGLNGICIPEKFGGSQISYRLFTEIAYIISQACAATGIIYGTNSAVGHPIRQFGNEQQKERFLHRLASGSLGALAITESEGGSDISRMKTTFKPDGDDIIINGEKIFITTGDFADFVHLFGKWTEHDGKGSPLTAIVLEKGTPGFEVPRLEKKMGMSASSTATLSFIDCRVSKDNVINGVCGGLPILLYTLNKSRPSVAANALGIAKAAFDDGLEYASERKIGKKVVMDFQYNQYLMADYANDIISTKALLDYVARLIDVGAADVGAASSMIKVKATDLCMKLTTDVVQLFGGGGYTSEYRAERLMREAKITQIWEGTNQVNRGVIANSLIQN
jgi:alkylation response protein AidB-like acyl-CoA dehydrogenase